MDIICDIDGTLANIQHRLHWITTKPKNWTAFFQTMIDDEPIQSVIDFLRLLNMREASVIYVSGRPDSHRLETQSWLRRHSLPGGPLYMRRAGDHRPDDIIKIELLAQIRNDGYDPKIAIDDRVRVCRAWRRAGLICMQLNEEEF